MLDFVSIANIIAVRSHSTLDEAWSGLSTAYLTLDRTRGESEQAAYLQNVGVLAVKREISKRYTDYHSGVLRHVCDEVTPDDENHFEQTAEQLAEHIGAVLNLSEGATEGIRAIANGDCSASADAIRWHLRKKGITNTRIKVKEVQDALRRIQTQ